MLSNKNSISLTVVLSLFTIISLSAQSPSFKWNPVLPQDDYMTIEDCITSPDLSTWITGYTGHENKIEGIPTNTPDMILYCQKAIQQPFKQAELLTTDGKEIGEGDYYGMIVTDAASAITYSTESGAQKMTGFGTKHTNYFQKLKSDGSADGTPKTSPSQFFFEVSPSGNYVAVFNSNSISLLNDKFETVAQADVEFPVSDRSFDLAKRMVSDEGDIFIFGGYYLKSSEENRTGANEEAAYFKVDLAKKEMLPFNISIGDVILESRDYHFDKDGSLRIGGLWKTNARNGQHGYYLVTINSDDLRTISSTEESFTDDFYNFIENTKTNDYAKFSGFFEYPDGSSGILMELTNPPASNGESRDILLLKIDPRGKQISLVHVPKFQIGDYDGYWFMFSHDKLYVFYNENKSNLSKEESKKMDADKSYKNNHLVMGVITEDGKVTRSEVPFPTGADGLVAIQGNKIDDSNLQLVIGDPRHRGDAKKIIVGIISF